jgi:hypothetical protein
MDYEELLQSNKDEDAQQRLAHLARSSSSGLAAMVASPLSDVHDAKAAKELLKQRGVQGVPL